MIDGFYQCKDCIYGKDTQGVFKCPKEQNLGAFTNVDKIAPMCFEPNDAAKAGKESK